ncbi:MAG: hypothetical protein KatS3mg026_0102 [Bacteroidia bacterium]|nr:MAG: hypothetical protein KatS3mg026_0102 [Bacteroidia bacterium]
MKEMNKSVILGGILLGLVGGCGLFRDPRANCNHPRHEEYVRQQQEARLAKQTRHYTKPGKKPGRVQKSCPNP